MRLPGLSSGDYLDHYINFAATYGIGIGPGVPTYYIRANSAGTGFDVAGTLSVSSAQSFANGTAAAPSIAFTNSTGLGFYRQADNVLGLALAGIASVAIGATAPTVAAATNTAGQDTYIVAPSAGGTATAARLGGALYARGGAGSAGSSGSGTVDAGAGAPVGWTGGAGGASTSTAGAQGGDGGAVLDTGGAGGSAAGTDPGGAGGAAGQTGGAGGAKTGTGTANGGAGGPWTGRGGDGAATASTSGASFGGAGGDGGVRAGQGGAATAGAVSGNGGSVPLRPGLAGAASGGSTAGTAGIVYVAGTAPMPFAQNQVYSVMADAAATLSSAQHRGGIISIAAGANDRIITTLTAAQLVAAFPGVQVGSTVPLEVINLKAANLVTMNGGANVTNVGNMIVGFVSAASLGGAGKFVILFTNVTGASEAAQLIRVGG